MTEDRLHTSIVRFLRSVLPHGWDVIHIPNNPRSAVAGARLKAMGMMKGAPDIMILGVLEREFYTGGIDDRIAVELPWIGFAEVKTQKGRLSSEQRKVHDRLKDKGIPVDVFRSIDDARDFIKEHGLPSREVRQ